MKKLRQEIDNALEERNEERFIELTDELNKLTNE
ncbi:IDEAL domain-containing protein [Cytobacillus kochii]|nr:IDEAL domain-containing protein [Cytobacillus kochii]